MFEKGVDTLYFGFDESNHAGPDKKGEIVTCTVSAEQDDSIVREYPNRRSEVILNQWLEDQSHDFRFTILTGDKYRYRPSSSNLVESIPLLVPPFLAIGSVKSVKLYLDGNMFKEEKNFLRNHPTFTGIEKVVVDNFIKKNKKSNGKTRKGPRCPRVIYIADSLSNYLLQMPIGDLLTHPKFIPTP